MTQDLVQETFLSAMRGFANFAGQSSVRSWLCGILKHKVCDYFRKRGRETPFTDLEFLADECADRFVPEGFWVHMTGPKEWRPEADEVMHRDDFWQTMRDCLSKLPERIATVFTLREMDEIESKEICSMLSISENNLWVMLHRARMALRECLALNWFEKLGGPALMAHWSQWTPNPRPPDDASTFQEQRGWLSLRVVLLIVRLTPKCPQVVRLLSLGMDQPLSLTTRLRLRVHYLMCSFASATRNSLNTCARSRASFPSKSTKPRRKSFRTR